MGHLQNLLRARSRRRRPWPAPASLIFRSCAAAACCSSPPKVPGEIAVRHAGGAGKQISTDRAGAVCLDRHGAAAARLAIALSELMALAEGSRRAHAKRIRAAVGADRDRHRGLPPLAIAKSARKAMPQVGQAIMNVLESARTTGLARSVLGVDHFGKSAETGTRGTSRQGGRRRCGIGGARRQIDQRRNHQYPPGGAQAPQRAQRRRFPFTVQSVELGVDRYGSQITSLVDPIGAARDNRQPERRQRWAKSLRLLRQALMNVLVDYGREQRPFADGPLVRAVDIETVRQEFYRSYPAEGDGGKTGRPAKSVSPSRYCRAGTKSRRRARVDGLTLARLINPQGGETQKMRPFSGRTTRTTRDKCPGCPAQPDIRPDILPGQTHAPLRGRVSSGSLCRVRVGKKSFRECIITRGG